MTDMHAFTEMIRTWKDLLGLSEEDAAFLASQKDVSRAILFFECALCGITTEQMKEMEEKKLDGAGIREKRKQILMERFREHDRLSGEIRALKESAQKRTAELEEVQKYYEEKLTASFEKEREALKAVITAKDEALSVCREHARGLQASLEEEKRREAVSSEEPKRRGLFFRRPPEKPSQPDPEAERVRREQEEFEEIQFRDSILRNPAYTKEQNEYLLSCFNNGVSYWTLAKIAHADLDVEFMKAMMERKPRRSGM